MGMLDGKVALVTGAARGIGAAVASLYLKEGARVLLTDIDADRGAGVGLAHGDARQFEPHDVALEADWDRVVAACLDRFGAIDVLVNNAGILQRGTIEEVDEAMLERSWRINQLGPYFGMKKVLPAMRSAGGGAIVNISSLGAYGGFPNIFAYGSSKWGVRGMTKSAARDLARYNIRVNNILPGFIDTEISADVSAEVKAQRAADIPLGRLGSPEDIAGGALYLASDLARYVTGEDLIIDGGLSL
jgi:3alpha(or 20beta)-hydroxysteroid dehydrogenase